MDLSFLSLPAAAMLLYALPLLLLPYLLRERGTRVVVPALFLYEDLAASAKRRLWGRLQLSRLFWLQLLIFLLLILIAAQPVLQHSSGSVAFVLDTSASMQATRGDERLFELAKRKLSAQLGAVSAEDTVGLFTSAPLPLPVQAPALPSPQLRQAVDHIEVTDAPDPSDDVLSIFLTQLREEGEFQQVVFFTDRPLDRELEDEPSTSDEFALRVVTVGEEQPNLGITSFRLYRSPFFPDELEATVVVEGLTPAESWQLSIEDVETGQDLQAQPVSQGVAPWTFSFPRLPLATTYRARLVVDARLDGLALDNEAYAVLPALTEVSVLLVTPQPEVAQSLSQIPYLKLKQVTPQEYDPVTVSRFSCVLFHLTAPETLPPSNTAFLLPPEGNGLFPLGQTAARPDITRWTVGHPLVSYVNFALFKPAFGQSLRPVAWSQPVIHATVGPVVLAGEQLGYRYAALGFDLLPYLGNRNLPASILTLNLLGWLAGQAGQPPSLKTGASLTLHGEAPQVHGPDGQLIEITGPRLLLQDQGVYRVTEHGVERQVAVNLSNVEESHLGRPLQLTMSAQSATLPQQTADRPLWPWILIVVLLLLAGERWLGTRSKYRAQTA